MLRGKTAGLSSVRVLEEEDMGRPADDMTGRLNFMGAKKTVAGRQLLSGVQSVGSHPRRFSKKGKEMPLGFRTPGRRQNV